MLSLCCVEPARPVTVSLVSGINREEYMPT
jgi:hypothetical protein